MPGKSYRHFGDKVDNVQKAQHLSDRETLSMIRRYLLRYAGDVSTFLKAYAMAVVGIFPLSMLTYGMHFPFVCLYIAAIGLFNILLWSALTGLLNNYIYKSAVFMLAAGWTTYYLWDVLSFEPSSIIPGAINVNRLLFAQVIFLFPICYAFLERAGIKARLARLLGPSPQDGPLAN